jgi:hypothetical protein
MANLNGENIGTNYKGIINMENLNEGIGADLQALTDGDGNFLPIKVNNDGNNVVLEISDSDRYIATIDNVDDSGIYLNFANSNFTYGGNNNNGNKLYIDDGSNSVSINSGGNSYFYAQGNTTTIGDVDYSNNATKLSIDDISSIIKTQHQNNEIGLKLDFANRLYQFGQIAGLNEIKFTIDDINTIIKTECVGFGPGGDVGLFFDYTNGIYNFGDYNFLVSGTSILINDQNQIIKTQNQGNDIGLKLDFATNQYQLGVQNNWDIVIDGAQRVITIGDWEYTFDGTHLVIDDTNQLITTSYQGNQTGLKLDFANQTYRLGDFGGFSLDIDKSNWQIFLGDWDNISNGTLFQLDDAYSIIKTLQQGVVDGIFIDMSNSLYQLGQVDGGDQVVFKVDGANGKFSTNRLTKPNGILLDIVGTTYSFGQLDGGNGTRLIVNDGAGFPLQVSGVNVLTATSGGSSGQHLKVKINGVDYVIKLENP